MKETLMKEIKRVKFELLINDICCLFEKISVSYMLDQM